MQHTQRAYSARRIPCRFTNCGQWFRSLSAHTKHLRVVHNYHPDAPDDSQQLPQQPPPDILRDYHEKLTGMSALFILLLALIVLCRKDL